MMWHISARAFKIWPPHHHITMWYVKRKAGNDTLVFAHSSSFFPLLLTGQSGKRWQNSGVPPGAKLCGNYKPFTRHWHYTARVTISLRLKSQSVKCAACAHLPRSLVSFSTWTKHIFRSRRGKIASSVQQRRCVSPYLHGRGREEKVGGG